MSFSYVFVWQKWGQSGGVLSNSYLIASQKEPRKTEKGGLKAYLAIHLKLRIEDKMRNGYESGIGIGIILSKQYKEEKKQTYDEKLGHQVLVEGQQ